MGDEAIVLAEHLDEHLDEHLATFYISLRKKYRDQFALRTALWGELETNKDLQRRTLAACAGNRTIFFNYFLSMLDQRNVPRSLPTVVPFALRPKQQELIETGGWIDERLRLEENGLIEKSRDEGATYLLGAYGLHGWLFKQDFKMGIGSRKAMLVDQLDNMDAIFPKIRFMLYRLPIWFLPEGFDRHEHDNLMRLKHPDPFNQAEIVGEGGDEIGRGGRTTVYVVDEAAFLARPRLADSALSGNTNTIIYVSTPNPFNIQNQFSLKRHSGTIKVFTLDWRSNPDKNFTAERSSGENGEVETYFPWYDAQVKKWAANPIIVQTEIDLDYSASTEGLFVPAEWARAAIDAHLFIPGMDRPWKRRFASLDVGDGSAENVYIYREGPIVRRLKAWVEGGTLQTGYLALQYCKEDGARFFRFDRNGPGATVSGLLNSIEEKNLPSWELDGRREYLIWEGYNAGDSTSYIMYSDDPEVTADERFTNRKAEDQWSIRLRFLKTYQMRREEAVYPVQELISIPNDPTLLAQISSVRYFITETGMIRSETKPELARREVASLDRWEALFMNFSAWPPPELPTYGLLAVKRM